LDHGTGSEKKLVYDAIIFLLIYIFFLPIWFSVVHGVTCLGFLQKGAVAPASKARIPPLGHEAMGFGHNDATVDIPLDTMNVMKFVVSLLTSTLELADF